MKVLMTLISILMFASVSFATPNQVIIKLKDGVNASKFKFVGGRAIEPLVPSMNLYLLKLESKGRSAITPKKAIKFLSRSSLVQYAQEDHKVVHRSAPDDKDFDQQWDMTFDDKTFGIDALDAWFDFGVGGVDALGNDIVVAVVDGGVDFEHEDLVDNIWINKGEIPDNGIDDDENGYIDDISGWNAYSDNNNVSPNRHGTHVAGTVGAVGGNGIGVTGVNQNVKIMGIGGSSGNTSVVLRAYGYALAQKKLWLETKGQKGANVVATNSSFGVDRGNCNSSSYEVWNDIYNEMGEYGILSAAATANRNWNIDTVGDVPTGCSSDYIISVTNTKRNGKRGNAGYGVETIDLAAPGTNIYSTLPNNRYGNNTGTSMATPHVAGAVGYLHSVASLEFASMAQTDPGDAALLLKEVMLETVRKMEKLESETVSGGILNLPEAAGEMYNLGSLTYKTATDIIKNNGEVAEQ